MYIVCGRHHSDSKSLIILMMVFIERLLCASVCAQHLSCFVSINPHHNSELTYYPDFMDEKNASSKKPRSLR